MARVVVGGVGIHYEVEGRGSPLVLQHGLSESLVNWYEFGYVDALARDHQLVLIDARGHGESDKPHDDSQYVDSAMPLDVVAVLDELKIERSAFFGHSLGGLIGLALAHYAPARFTALGIGGAGPDASTSSLIPSKAEENLVSLLEQGPAGMLTAWQTLSELSPQLTERVLAIDCAAMIACLKGPRERNVRDTDTLAQFPGRYRFFVGENDLLWIQALNAAAERLEPGSVVTYPGMNHLQYLLRSDLVVPNLRAFFDDGP